MAQPVPNINDTTGEDAMNHLGNRHLMALALSLGLAACGGGGGGGSSSALNDSAAAPFGLTGTSPANGATGVARNVQPAATFNQGLNAAGVGSSSAWLFSALGLPIAAAVSASGSVLTVKPVAGTLPGGTTYTFTLSPGLQSSAGALLGSTVTAAFSTLAPQWSGVAQISSPAAGGNAMFASAAADAAGNVTVAWYQDNGVRNIINASRYSNGAWSTPVQVDSAGATGNAFTSSLAADSAGNVMAAWQQNNGTRNIINASRYSQGAWSAPVQIDSPAATGAADTPRLVVDRGGNVTAAWTQIRGARAVLNSSRYSQGAWSTPVEADNPAAAGGAVNPVLAADAAGNILMVWYQDTGTRFVINASRYGAAGWSTPVQVDNPAATGTASTPALAMDAAGNATAAWIQLGAARTVINASRLQ